MLLEGLHIPLTTPFHPDGRLNHHKLAANVVRYSKSPAGGLIALAAHAGEPTLLTENETREVLRTVAEAASSEKILLAHIAHSSVHAAIELAELAMILGYDGVLLESPELILPVQTRELLTWFRAVADRSPLPVILSTVHRPIAQELIAELAFHPNILGLLTSAARVAGDSATPRCDLAWLLHATAEVRRTVNVTKMFAAVPTRMLRASHSDPALVPVGSLTRSSFDADFAIGFPPHIPAFLVRGKSVGFQILTASATNALANLRAGAIGIAPAFAACAPQACYEVYAAWKDDDQPLADEKQQRLTAAAQFAEVHAPAALKFGCDLNGYFGGLPRLPYLPLTAEQRTELQTLMSPMRT